VRLCNELAGLLANCPNPKCREPKRADELAKRAVQTDEIYGITLGIAQFRAGELQPARESLEKAMALRNGGDCADWFFLAMVHWQLGNKAKAREWYDKAEQLMATHHHPDWPRIRSEAADLLGIAKKKD